MFDIKEKIIDLGNNQEITLQTGKLARQADGAVVVKMGKTMLLATVVSSKEAKEGIDFFPLSCDYREMYASVGRFPGGFFKREARPSNYEILIARLVDRVLRPLFPDNYRNETFVNITLFSADKDIKPDALAGLAASAALSVSDIPFNGPISEARVGRLNGELIINPSFSQLEKCDIDIMIGATIDNIMMVEGEMNEVSEKEMLEAIEFGHEAIKKQCQAQIDLAKEVNKTKRETLPAEEDENLKKEIYDKYYPEYYELAKKGISCKDERKKAFSSICEKYIEAIPEDSEIKIDLVKKYFHDTEKEAIRNVVLKEKTRLDGRKLEEIRPISCEVDVLESAHGSSLFTRGETQSLSTVTLGTKLDEQSIDGAMVVDSERFILHYNFPPFSTGDARPNRGTSRREVGHGNLAHRALYRMIPTEESLNPYTIRVVSDILESNGSSSMATVCAGSLALMDSGVKMKKPVSGIAMGLITDKDGNYAVLSDILGDEDHLGDMDFKVTGTKDGITACQMDIKVDGLSFQILEKALLQAKEGRNFILDIMTEVIPQPNADYKPHAPRINKMTIPKELVGAVIGPGGKVIREIEKQTGAKLIIDTIDEIGVIEIAAEDKEAIDKATKWVEDITAQPEVGEVYEGKVVSIMPYGAFVEFMPDKEGLLHISEIEWRRINKVEDVLKEGEKIKVKLLNIENGKFRLSRKVLLPKPDNK